MNDGVNVMRRQSPPAAREEPQVPEPAPEPEVAGDGPSVRLLAERVAGLPVDEVMARVEAGEWDAAEVYVAEEDGKGRSTLLQRLQGHAG